MKSNWIWVLPAFTVLSNGCASRITTTHVAPKSAPPPGIHYFLPRTIVRVSVPVKETVKTPGQYADLALHFFPHVEKTSVIRDSSTTYTIQREKISFTPRGVRDPNLEFVLVPTGQWFADTTFQFSVDAEGVATKIDATVDNKSVEIGLAFAEAAGGIAAKAFSRGIAGGPAALKDKVPPPSTPCNDAQAFNEVEKAVYAKLSGRYLTLFCYLPSELRLQVFPRDGDWRHPAALLSFMSAEFAKCGTAAGYDPNCLRDEKAGEKLSRFLGAERLVYELDKIEAENPDFLNGQRLENVQPPLWKDVSDQRKNRVTEILTFFFGTRTVDPDYWSGSFDVDMPDAGPLPRQELFKFSPQTGICTLAPDSATIRLVSPVDVNQAGCGPSASTESVFLGMSTVSAPVALSGSPTPPTPPAGTGITYRLPGLAQVSLFNTVRTVTGKDGGEQTTETASNQIARQFVEIAQLGRLASLPPKVGGMSTQYSLQLDPATGMLREILVGNKAAITSDAIRRAGGVVTSAIDTKRAADAANQAPAPLTEQQRLAKERSTKEELLRIRLIDECLADSSRPGCAALVGVK